MSALNERASVLKHVLLKFRNAHFKLFLPAFHFALFFETRAWRVLQSELLFDSIAEYTDGSGRWRLQAYVFNIAMSGVSRERLLRVAKIIQLAKPKRPPRAAFGATTYLNVQSEYMKSKTRELGRRG